ncbi:gamma-glutamyl-gamma-aminobutyrate hydrolase family protein [Paeniglutamicibacter antarcticus]|uniref:Gamma-glutamyl-gamma-aminobutyrate hydrolase family protein n=1 Tax=Paeniglutamicibacter antarcticus TaxID=494023 RepID=A0ABP9TQE7_9MICC
MAMEKSYRPRIGLTTYWQDASWGVWNSQAAIVPGKYVTGVADAGGTPILLPPVGSDESVLELLDGLIVIGGVDVDPSNYGATAHPRTAAQPDRDEHDLRLTRVALGMGLPLFAICRGAQILNVALGGTLHQHVPDVLPKSNYQPSPGVFGTVEFTTEASTLARELLGGTAEAPCYHHQSLDRLGEGLVATARASDGTIEAVECPTGIGWMLGVQFHPEENPRDARLFAGFVEAARKYRYEQQQESLA